MNLVKFSLAQINCEYIYIIPARVTSLISGELYRKNTNRMAFVKLGFLELTNGISKFSDPTIYNTPSLNLALLEVHPDLSCQ